MKLTYLGTAAAEGMPAVFCNCDYCRRARVLGGKDIRTRSQAMIDDVILIDLPADTYHHFLINGIEGDRIQYLLITHPHGDHLYPEELNMRRSPFAHGMRVPALDVYCAEDSAEKIRAVEDIRRVRLHTLKPFDTVLLGDYEVTALPARHMEGKGEPLFYIVKRDATILYAHDTGYFFDEVFDYIEKKRIIFDLVSMDCTNVDIPISDHGGHMGLPNIARVLARLREMGAIREDTKTVINHFSHNAAPFYDELSQRAAKDGMLVSYDGMTVTVGEDAEK